MERRQRQGSHLQPRRPNHGHSAAHYGSLRWGGSRPSGGRWGLARAVLVLGALNVVALGGVFGLLAQAALPTTLADPARRPLAFFLGAVLTITNFWIFRIATYGLETGMYLLLLGTFVLYVVRVLPRMELHEAVGAGALAGLCGLARIDFGVILLIFLGVLVLRRQIALGHGIALGLTALAVVAPWFAWVHSVTGSWLPSSGPAQASLITAEGAQGRLLAMGHALVNHLTPWTYTGSRDSVAALALLSLVALGAFLWVWRRRSAPIPPRPVWSAVMGAFLAAVGVTLVVYVSLFWATHFYDRYSAPLLVVVLPGLAWLIATLAPLGLLRRMAVPGAAALGLCFFAWAAVTLHRGAIGNQHAVTAGFVRSEFPDVRVGAFQSGVIGFYNPNVYNLDGKIDPRALVATEGDSLDAYVDRMGLSVLVDWSEYLKSIDSTYLATEWQPCRERPNNTSSICFERR